MEYKVGMKIRVIKDVEKYCNSYTPGQLYVNEQMVSIAGTVHEITQMRSQKRMYISGNCYTWDEHIVEHLGVTFK